MQYKSDIFLHFFDFSDVSAFFLCCAIILNCRQISGIHYHFLIEQQFRVPFNKKT